MMKFLIALWLLISVSAFGAVPAYTSFRGTGGILVTSNPPTGNITFDGSGIFTSSGTNATLAISTNGVLVMVAATNINFITGSNVFLAATNIGSSAHIGFNAFTPVPFIEGAVTNLLLTWILPILTVDSLTVSNLLAAPPLSSVQYNSNGITRGSPGLIYTNGQLQVADVVIAGQGVEVTAGSFVLNGGDTALVSWNGLGRMRWPTGGVVRFEDEFGNLNRVQLGGDTAAFPAIGRTNGDVIILGGNGAFKLGGSTNRLIAPAVHIANDGAPGTTLLSLDNPLSAIRWNMAIDSHPETYFLGLGRVGDATYAMVWELGGNVGVGITNPTVRLDVQGRFMARSNVYFPNISSNALPVALLATDSQGEVYETAVPTVGASAETNAVLTNLIGTVARNVTNVVSLSTSNATSKPLTNSYTGGVLTVFGVEAGANVTITPNGSNLVIAATGGSSTPSPPMASVQFHRTGGIFGGTNLFVYDETNNRVGIGVAAPTERLDIVDSSGTGAIGLVRNTTASSFASWQARGDNAGQNFQFVMGGTTRAGTSFGVARSAAGTGLALGYANNAPIAFGTSDNFDFTLGANNLGVVTIKGTAMVGINNTSPTNALDNTGNTSLRSNVWMHALPTNASPVAMLATDAAGKVFETAVPAGGFAAGNSNQIPFINGAGTAYTYAGYLSQTNPGFGFSPSGNVGGGYGGLMVFGNSPMGLVTIGHPNAGSDFATFTTALVVSNRYNSAADFKNDMVKIDAVMIGGGLRADSTMTRWRVWNGTTSSNDVAELTIGGTLTLAGGLPTNNAAFTITTNNFALDTYYTNMPQRSWVSASIGMTNVLLTEKAWVGLYLDQDGDGTWERTGINVRLQGISALAGVEQLGAFLQPSARFIFTNLGTAANSSIEPNSSQWVKQ